MKEDFTVQYSISSISLRHWRTLTAVAYYVFRHDAFYVVAEKEREGKEASAQDSVC